MKCDGQACRIFSQLHADKNFLSMKETILFLSVWKYSYFHVEAIKNIQFHIPAFILLY